MRRPANKPGHAPRVTHHASSRTEFDSAIPPIPLSTSVYVFDLDGVIYRMDERIPYAVEAVNQLQQRDAMVYFLTNNSSKSRADYVEKLAHFEIHVGENAIMTSAYALGQLFVERGDVGKSVYVIGESGLKNELDAVGMRVVEYSEDQPIDFVVSGWDRQFSYQKLSEGHLAIARGAQFIATNRDATYPDAGGRTLPGSGALVAALETCSGVTPLTIGKPEPYTLELIIRQARASPGQCLVIGDRLDTDIGIGKAVAAKTALVLTGVHKRADLASFPQYTPDFVWNDLSELSSSIA